MAATRPPADVIDMPGARPPPETEHKGVPAPVMIGLTIITGALTYAFFVYGVKGWLALLSGPLEHLQSGMGLPGAALAAIGITTVATLYSMFWGWDHPLPAIRRMNPDTRERLKKVALYLLIGASLMEMSLSLVRIRMAHDNQVASARAEADRMARSNRVVTADQGVVAFDAKTIGDHPQALEKAGKVQVELEEARAKALERRIELQAKIRAEQMKEATTYATAAASEREVEEIIIGAFVQLVLSLLCAAAATMPCAFVHCAVGTVFAFLPERRTPRPARHEPVAEEKSVGDDPPRSSAMLAPVATVAAELSEGEAEKAKRESEAVDEAKDWIRDELMRLTHASLQTLKEDAVKVQIKCRTLDRAGAEMREAGELATEGKGKRRWYLTAYGKRIARQTRVA